MSFRRLLIGGFASALALTAVTCVVAMVALHGATSDSERVARLVTDDLQVVGELRYRAQRFVAETRGYLLTGDQSDFGRYEGARRSFEDALATLPDHPALSQSARAVREVARTARAYRLVASEAVRERAAGLAATQIRGYFDAAVDPARVSFERAVDAYVARERDGLEAAIARSRTYAERADTLLLLFSLLTIGVAVSLGYLVVRRLSRQFEDLRQAREAAHRAATARQEVLAVVSHDLRNPLNAVVLGSELLQKLPPSDARIGREIQRIRRAARVMDDMIDELLDDARLASGTLELHREHVPLRELGAAVSELFQPRADEHGVALACDLDEGLIYADRARILRVLANLIGNALKHTPRGGTIDVEGHVTPDGDVRIEVRDTGTGIAPEALPHLFERYWQGRDKHRARGLGLGLAICKELVDAHGGRIGAESVVGQGTTAWFVVPGGSAVEERRRVV